MGTKKARGVESSGSKPLRNDRASLHGNSTTGHPSGGRAAKEKPKRFNLPVGLRSHVTATYDYLDAEGKVALRVFRIQVPGKKKEFRQCGLNGAGSQYYPAPKTDLPLWRLGEVLAAPDDALVIVCEGEKAADAAHNAFAVGAFPHGKNLTAVGVTWSGGSPKGAIYKTDWAPLAGRKVVVWADNDAPGAKAGDLVCAKLAGLGCEVLLVQIQPDWPKSADAADFDAAAVREAVNAALPWQAAPEAPETPKTKGRGRETAKTAVEASTAAEAQTGPVDALTLAHALGLRKIGDEWHGACPNPACDADDDGFYVRLDNNRVFCRKCCPDGKDAAAFKTLLRAIEDKTGLKMTAAPVIDLVPGGQGAKNKLDEAAAADLFVLTMRGQFAFDVERGAWRQCRGGIWRQGHGAEIEAIRETSGGLLRRFNNMANALRIAAAPLRVEPGDWGPYEVAAFRGGWIDLETGEVHRSDTEANKVKLAEYRQVERVATPAEKVPEAWRKFVRDGLLAKYDLLEREEIERWVQAWLYDSLRGRVGKWEYFLFLQGPPGSGKSTFADAVRGAFGGHAISLAGEKLAKDMNAHRSWLARLNNRRLAIVPEIPNRRANWQSADLNSLASGEKIEVNYMRRNPFDMIFRGGLMVLGNSRPSAPAESGIWRRMAHLESVAVAKPDPELKERLKADPGGVLRWSLDGREGADAGLPKHLPGSIARSVAEYQKSEDVLEQWIEERCDVGPDLEQKAKVLLEDYNHWREQYGMRKTNATSFGRALRDKGFGHRESGAIIRIGLRLKGQE